MTRINPFRNITLKSVAWGKVRSMKFAANLEAAASPLIFAAVLIACSLTVGCSSNQPKPVTAAQPSIAEPPLQSAIPTPPLNTTTAALTNVPKKVVHKKVTRKAPPTLTFTDPSTGVSFQYPPKDSLKTSTSASDLVASTATPMDFIQPGGTVVAAVALPPSAYPDSNLVSAFFNVSVNKSLTADQCSEFSVPQPNPANPADPTIQATAQVSAPPVAKSKLRLMIGDLELQSSQPEPPQTSTNPTQQTAKYFHVFENNACYEFALQISTNKPDASKTTKPVDPDQVFRHLEQILATVKILPGAEPTIDATTHPQPEPTQTSAQ